MARVIIGVRGGGGGGGRTTRYGSAYFLSSSCRMKKELVPVYSISATRISAAAECSTGIDTRFSTAAKMTASRSVQSPSWHSGSSSPCVAGAGRRTAGRGSHRGTQHAAGCTAGW